MNSPVTVLLPVYNGQQFLEESIESILLQHYVNFELLIINDGSTDDSENILTQYSDPRIRIIHHQKNVGLVRTLNEGLSEARHELIARHDQDDIAYPERLQYQIEYMNRHPEVGVCGCAANILENKKVKVKVVFPSSDSLIRWDIQFHNPLIHPSIMYRRSVVQAVSGYSTDADAEYNEDYDLWWRLLPQTKFYNISRPLLDLRKHNTNMTVARKEFHIEQTIKITKKYLDKALGYDISIHLIRWLRGFPVQSTDHRGRVKLMFLLYRVFNSHTPLSPLDWGKITINAGIRAIKAMKHSRRF